MRHTPLGAAFHTANRERLRALLPPHSLAIISANDVPPTNADGTLPLVANSDLFYFTGIEQEQTLLLLFPDAPEPQHRELLFLREAHPELKVWEGYKHTQEDAQALSGIENVRWLTDYAKLLHPLMCDAEQVFLNANEHRRAVVEVESRDARLIASLQAQYPLHAYRRLAPLLHALRVVKQPTEMEALKTAIRVTRDGFFRTAKAIRPGIWEHEIEAEWIHEFTRQRCRFAYNPILASGVNSCVLHYNANDQQLQAGQLVLMDVGACYANYNADLTRTLPVSGRFTPRQKAVYNAVLRVLTDSVRRATPGKLHREWQREAQLQMNQELASLGLLTSAEANAPFPPGKQPACFKYFMHGLGHSLGLDVHDVGSLNVPFQVGQVLTVEPGIYLPEEGFGIRLENNILLTDAGQVDLMAEIPIEADDIEALMASP